MQKTKIILFTGSARHGKDTSASFMKESLEAAGKSVIIYHFADPLKMLCNTSYGWVMGDKGPVGRSILQNVGTMYRKNNPMCWVNICRQIAAGTDADYMLVPDCRYQTEANGFKDFDYSVCRVIRPNFDNGLTEEQKNHSSERDMENYKVDFTINNEFNLDVLKKDVTNITEFLLRPIGQELLFHHQEE